MFVFSPNTPPLFVLIKRFLIFSISAKDVEGGVHSASMVIIGVRLICNNGGARLFSATQECCQSQKAEGKRPNSIFEIFWRLSSNYESYSKTSGFFLLFIRSVLDGQQCCG